MKTLLVIGAASMIASSALAGAGLEAEYTLDGGAGQSVGGFVNVVKEFGQVSVGPQISAGIVDPGSFMSGEQGIYGDIALTAQLGTKLKINAEVGYEYIHTSGEQYHDLYVSTGLEFPIGTTLSLYTDVKWRGKALSNRTIGAGVKLAF